VRLLLGAQHDGWERYESVVDAQPSTPIRDEMEGDFLLYSSGTTGRPKGIKRALALAPMGQGPPAAVPFLQALGFASGDVYLCPAPLYHAAPLAWSMAAHRLGGTVVVMERFDPAECLALIERYHVTHAQFVPTMFVRMLKLDPAVRAKYDVASLRCAIHASAPCPVRVKHAMIDWWGPILEEYYSGTEGMGATTISSAEWLAHPGSVGRPSGFVVHIVGDDDNELPPLATGRVFFESDRHFEYLHDPEKTASVRDAHGWRTLGDVGYLDADGYLYLTDRATFMIVSGGVNIYPQEIEDLLIGHPAVHEVAVFGVPNEEFGEEVKAVVQTADHADPGPDLERTLIEFCRDNLAHYKAPRSIDFVTDLPRDPNGKLYKRHLRERYWGDRTSRIM
jgi:acyl-CoA synthetase (AMP-forming)/AMP-acid ligase II